jgi:hypothetical protein
MYVIAPKALIILNYFLFIFVCFNMDRPEPAVSETLELEVRGEVDKEVVVQGETFIYTITIIGTQETDVDIPDLGKKIGDFPVVNSYEEERTEGSQKIVEKHYILKAVSPGTYILPGVVLSYKNNNIIRSTETQQLNIIVVSEENDKTQSTDSTQDKPSEDIKDIKPLQTIKVPLSWYLISGGTVLFFLIAALLIYFFVKRRKYKPKPVTPQLQPNQAAYEALEALDRSNFIDRGEFKLFHYRLSEIFRTYLEAQYGFSATDLTTEEILSLSCTHLHLSEQKYQSLSEVLKETDLVKFSDTIPTKIRSMELFVSVKKFIEETYRLNERVEEKGGSRDEI